MKKTFKKFTFFALSFFIFSILVNAESINYKEINKTTTFESNNLKFYSIRFKDNSNSSTLSYGLTGSVYNTTNNDLEIKSVVNYYDSNKNLITSSTSSQIIKAKDFTSYDFMSSIINKEYSVSDIQYYSLSITTDNLSKNTLPSENSSYQYKDYVIDSYNVNITVNENNTFDIEETITAYFNVSKHGIYRTIPLKNEITRLNGTTTKNKAKVTNLKVDKQFSTSKENGNLKIKIGSPSKTLKGSQKYIISYNYNIGKDPIEEYDEFYYDIIGDNWDTVIGNVTFTITMPKEFDASKLGFSTGYKGSTNNDNIVYSVKDNVITGQYNDILSSKQALTIRIELPEGYFVNAGFETELQTYLLFIIPLFSLIIVFILWYKYGRDDEVVETIEFYPPEGFNSLEIGYLYKGKADNLDVTSLLIYLANKGYIKIEETEKKVLFTKVSDFKITKLKEYDGNNLNEEIFLNGLFKKNRFRSLFTSDNENIKTEVTKNDLYNSFYLTTRRILTNINNKENKNKIFEKYSFLRAFIIVLLILISIITFIGLPILDNYGTATAIMVLFIVLFYTPFYAVMFSKGINATFRIMWSLITIIHSLSFLIALPLKDVIFSDKIYLYSFIFGILCVIIMIKLLKAMPKRTQYGIEMLGKIKGFKTFLQTCEKEKLETYVMSHPTYFYDILPYTYVLGISDKWIEKFEDITLQAPNWYAGYNAFNVHHFSTFMNSTMASAKNVMSSSPSSGGSSSSGGRSSGGGSSGGGSGGGGGGSW